MVKTLTFANACGALATTRLGSLGLMLGSNEVEEFIISHPLDPPIATSFRETT
jgi:sugar/nucleoside kinase (ribokinase family)